MRLILVLCFIKRQVFFSKSTTVFISPVGKHGLQYFWMTVRDLKTERIFLQSTLAASPPTESSFTCKFNFISIFYARFVFCLMPNIFFD